MIHPNTLFRIALGLLLCSSGIHAQVVQIEITGIRSVEGQFLIDVYPDEKAFQKERPILSKKFQKEGLQGDRMMVQLELAPGTYGFTLVDDENSNGKMDYKLIGATKEGFGFSNFYLSAFKKPAFEDFSFVLEKDQVIMVTMKIRYM